MSLKLGEVDIANVGVSTSNDPLNLELLTYAETVNLEADKVYAIDVAGDISFVLPTVVDSTHLHQIIVHMRINNVVNVNLGTTNYFKLAAPDLSQAGSYNIIYEYDVLLQAWVADACIKGALIE